MPAKRPSKSALFAAAKAWDAAALVEPREAASRG
jgi:hypothetical protein